MEISKCHKSELFLKKKKSFLRKQQVKGVRGGRNASLTLHGSQKVSFPGHAGSSKGARPECPFPTAAPRSVGFGKETLMDEAPHLCCELGSVAAL